MKNILKTKLFIVLIITICVFVLTEGLNFSGILTVFENKTYDERITKTANSSMPSEEIAVIFIDQESLDFAQKELNWSWPWPRSAYADIVSFLNLANAKSVAFDIVYTEPSIYGEQDDKAFADASLDYQKVIQTLYCEVYGNTEKLPTNPILKRIITDNPTLNQLQKTSPNQPALFPIPELASSTGIFGHIASTIDTKDSMIRRTRLFQEFDNEIIPSLGIAGVALNTENPTLSFSEDNQTYSFCDYNIKVDKEDAVYLRYKGDLQRYVPYSAQYILQSYWAIQKGEEPLFYPEDFKNMYVFCALYAPGLFDIAPTPISKTYPGVGVHITALDNLLSNDFLQETPLYIDLLITLLFAFLGSLYIKLSEKIKIPQARFMIIMIISILGLSFLYVLLATYLFKVKYILPIICPLIALILSFISSVFVNYNTEGKQKRYLKSAFKQYLSPIVIEELIAHPERLKLGGERKEISIFFSDVQGFTTISEKMTPEELTSLLNDYLSEMSDIILASGGTIDKYEGDAIIAFWNAPIFQENHSKRALEAAIQCQQKLAEMEDVLQQRVGSKLLMRIGLNTGTAVVGNMGSHNRFDYTMLGDSVNLAARLEGLNKQFGTYTMCTKAMKEKAESFGTQIKFRELARVAVVGKTEPVTVFEPMTSDVFSLKEKEISIFNKARTLFYEGNFDQALELFNSILQKDMPSKFYAQKCMDLIKNKPDNWQGVWVATSK